MIVFLFYYHRFNEIQSQLSPFHTRMEQYKMWKSSRGIYLSRGEYLCKGLYVRTVHYLLILFVNDTKTCSMFSNSVKDCGFVTCLWIWFHMQSCAEMHADDWKVQQFCLSTKHLQVF